MALKEKTTKSLDAYTAAHKGQSPTFEIVFADIDDRRHKFNAWEKTRDETNVAFHPMVPWDWELVSIKKLA